MTNTTNYDLILVEGSDKVNPLTQVNPNFETIDAEMKKNKDAGVSTATELLTGSIHGLQRANADASMFRFTATSNYTAGDTFTVDGIQVTALTPTGEALGNGAYIIGSEVLCCLKGTLLTMFLSGGTVTTADNALKLGGQEPEYYGTAADVAQAQSTATAAGVLANSVQTQLTDFKGKFDYKLSEEEVVGKWVDGKTIYRQVINKSVSIPQGRSNQVLALIPNVENVIRLDARGKNQVENIPLNGFYDSSYNSRITYNYTSSSVALQAQWASNSTYDCTIIIEYTKVE